MDHFFDYGVFEDELKTILNIRPDYEYQPFILKYWLYWLLCSYKKQLLFADIKRK